MKIYHPSLASGRWFTFSLAEQLANVGSDIERTIQWKKKGDLEYSNNAFERALELLDLTIADPKHRKRLKEILRVREALIDYFMFDNDYKTDEIFWNNYFLDFNYAAAVAKGR